MAKKKTGRPPKPADKRQTNLLQVVVDDALASALERYVEREAFTARTEAIRRLLRQALKTEGLL